MRGRPREMPDMGGAGEGFIRRLWTGTCGQRAVRERVELGRGRRRAGGAEQGEAIQSRSNRLDAFTARSSSDTGGSATHRTAHSSWRALLSAPSQRKLDLVRAPLALRRSFLCSSVRTPLTLQSRKAPSTLIVQ